MSTAVLSFMEDTEAPSRNDVQQEMLRRAEQVRLSGRSGAILQAPTGFGKTFIAAEWIKRGVKRGGRFLFLAHRDILIDQAAAEFVDHGIKVAIEQADRKALDAMSIFGGVEVVVGSKDTLQGRRLEQWDRNRFTDILIDECFPAGTLVDGCPIEWLRPGDHVRSFSHVTQKEEVASVVAVSSRKAVGLVRVHLDDGSNLVCTPNHPIYTCGHGYVDAANLRDSMYLYRPRWDGHNQFGVRRINAKTTQATDSELRSLWSGAREATSEPVGSANLLGGVQEGKSGSKENQRRGGLRDLQEKIPFVESEERRASTWRDRPVFERVLEEFSGCDSGVYAGAIRQPGGIQKEDEGTQPDVAPGHQSKNDGVKGQGGLEAESAGWQRAGADAATAGDGRCSWVADGSGSSNQDASLERIPDLLQDRRGKHGTEDWRGDRRTQPCLLGREGEGQEEGGFPCFPRVVRVEVLEPGRDGSFGGVCPGGIVYNIEVERNNNYFVAGILVHNCHLATAKTFGNVLEHFDGASFRLGLSATPYRLDRTPLYGPDDSLFGGGKYRDAYPWEYSEHKIHEALAFKYPLGAAIRNGHLAQVIAGTMNCNIDLKGLRISRSGAKDFNRFDLDARISQMVGPMANETVKRLDELGIKRALLYAPEVKSAIAFADALNGIWRGSEGNRAAAVWTGSKDNPLSEHKKALILEGAKRGDFRVVCSCDLLTTGYNDPNVEAVIIARPTRSHGLFLQCLDQKTEILTPHGWANRGRISKGDLVAAFDVKTGEIKWSPAEDVFDRDLAPGEKMFELSSPTLDIRVTGGHRMVYRKKVGRKRKRTEWMFATAEELASQPKYEIPISGVQKSCGPSLSDDEIRFIGWFMTDGTLNRRTNAIFITQSEHQPYNEDIKKCLEGCGFGWREYRVNRKTQFSDNSTVIQYMVPKGDPRGENSGKKGWGHLSEFLSKDFAESLLCVDSRQLRVLLEAMHLGDGSKQNGKTWTRRSYHISTGNRLMADRLQAVCVLRGMKCNIGEHTYNRNPLYVLHIKDTQFRHIATCKTDKRPALVESEVIPGEKVWCVQNELGTLVTRRNGKVAIVGNCVGRATRILEHKRQCYVLGYQWEGDDGVVSSLDLFLEDEPSARVRAKAKELAAKRQDQDVNVLDLLDEAKEQARADEREEERLAAQKIRVSVEKQETNFKFTQFTPFNVGPVLGIDVIRDMKAARVNPPTQKQVEFLERHGMKKVTGLTREGADQVITEILDRKLRMRVGPEEIKKLVKRGIPLDEARSMNREQAQQILGKVNPRLRSWLRWRGFSNDAINNMGQEKAAKLYASYRSNHQETYR